MIRLALLVSLDRQAVTSIKISAIHVAFHGASESPDRFLYKWDSNNIRILVFTRWRDSHSCIGIISIFNLCSFELVPKQHGSVY